MYSISWSQEVNGGAVSGARRVQYLPDIADVIREAFGTGEAQMLVIVKESD